MLETPKDVCTRSGKNQTNDTGNQQETQASYGAPQRLNAKPRAYSGEDTV